MITLVEKGSVTVTQQEEDDDEWMGWIKVLNIVNE